MSYIHALGIETNNKFPLFQIDIVLRKGLDSGGRFVTLALIPFKDLKFSYK